MRTRLCSSGENQPRKSGEERSSLTDGTAAVKSRGDSVRSRSLSSRLPSSHLRTAIAVSDVTRNSGILQGISRRDKGKMRDRREISVELDVDDVLIAE